MKYMNVSTVLTAIFLVGCSGSGSGSGRNFAEALSGQDQTNPVPNNSDDAHSHNIPEGGPYERIVSDQGFLLDAPDWLLVQGEEAVSETLHEIQVACETFTQETGIPILPQETLFRLSGGTTNAYVVRDDLSEERRWGWVSFVENHAETIDNCRCNRVIRLAWQEGNHGHLANSIPFALIEAFLNEKPQGVTGAPYTPHALYVHEQVRKAIQGLRHHPNPDEAFVGSSPVWELCPISFRFLPWPH